MNKRKPEQRSSWLVLILATLSIALVLEIALSNNDAVSFVDILREYEGTFGILAVGITVVLFTESIIMLIIQKRQYNTKYAHQDVDNLNKLLEYSKKRAEIEQEISRLTSELAHSNVGEYLNMNHLIFSGQSGVVGNGAINYDQFLSQFGIERESVQVKKGLAVFLTSFDPYSTRLYQTCSTVLNGIGILLQRTDNTVEKNDIMMNIVSQIVRAEFIIVNIDGRNPNVYYELGIAHAIGKPTILISRTEFPENSIGFDIRQKQIVLYKDDTELEKALLYQVNRILNN